MKLKYLMFFLIPLFFSCSLQKRKNKKEFELISQLNKSKGISIDISDFTVCYPFCKLSTSWHITDNYIDITSPDKELRAFMQIKSDDVYVRTLIDSMVLLATQITDSIKPAWYDCEDVSPGGIGVIGEGQYFNRGTNFKFHLKDSVANELKWKGFYRIFQCEQKLFVRLLEVLNKLILIHTERKNNDLLIPELQTNGCDCKEFKFGRIFVD